MDEIGWMYVDVLLCCCWCCAFYVSLLLRSMKKILPTNNHPSYIGDFRNVVDCPCDSLLCCCRSYWVGSCCSAAPGFAPGMALSAVMSFRSLFWWVYLD